MLQQKIFVKSKGCRSNKKKISQFKKMQQAVEQLNAKLQQLAQELGNATIKAKPLPASEQPTAGDTSSSEQIQGQKIG